MLIAKHTTPPVEPDEREAWFDSLAPEMQAAAEFEARAAFRGDDPPKPAVTEAFKRIMHARWRVYLKSPREFRGAAEEAAKAAKREAWQAQHGAAYEAHLRATGGVA
jgi:hypothetical protein